MAGKNDLEVKIAVSLDTASIQSQLAELESRLSKLETTIKINTDTKEAEEKIKTFGEKIGENLKEAGNKLEGIGTKMSTFGSGLTGMFGGATSFAKDCIETFMEFDLVMANIKATAGLTEEQLQNLSTLAGQLATTTKYSNTEVAESMLALAKGGMSVEQIYGTIPNVLNLATVGNIDLADSADYTTKILNSFGLASEDTATMVQNTARVTDVLAQAANNSTLDVAQLATYLGNCSGTGELLGYSIEDVCSVLMVLSDNGLQAGKATIALRNIMMTMAGGELKLCAQGMEDVVIKTQNADGTMKSLQDILLECNGAFGTMTEAQQIQAATSLVGKTNAEAFVKAVNNANGKIQENSQLLEDSSGAAQKYNDTVMDTPSGKYEELHSAYVDLKTAIGEGLIPILTPFMNILKNVVKVLGKMDPKVVAVVVAIGGFLGVLGSAIGGLAAFLFSTGLVLEGLGSLVGIISAVVGAIGAIPLVIIAVVGVITYELIKHWDKIKEWFSNIDIKQAIMDKWNGVKEWFSNLDIVKWVSEKWNEVKEWFSNIDIIKWASEKWSEFKEWLGNLSIVQAVSNTWNEFKEWLGNAVNSITKPFKDFWDSVVSTFQGIGNFFKEIIEPWVEPFQKFFEKVGSIFDSIKESISQKINETWEGIKQTFKPLIQWFNDTWTQMVEGFSNIWNTIVDIAEHVWGGIKSVFSEVTGWVNENIVNPVKDAWDTIATKFNETWEGIKQTFEPLIQWFNDAWTQISEGFSKAGDVIKDVAGAIWEGIKAPFVSAGTWWEENVASPIKEGWNGAKEYIGKKWTEWKEGFTKDNKEAANNFRDWVNNMPNDWQGCVDYIGQAWNEKMEGVKNKISETKQDIINKWEEVKTGVSNKTQELKNAIINKWEEVKTDVSNKTQELKTAIVNKWEEVKRGVSEKANNIKTSVSEAFHKIIDPVKEVVKNVKDFIGKLGEIKVPNPIELIKKGFNGIRDAIKSAKEWLDQFNLTNIKDKVVNVTKNIFSSSIEEPVQQTLEPQDEEEFNTTKSILSMQDTSGAMGQWFNGTWGKMKEGFSGSLNYIVNIIEQTWEKVKSIFISAGTWWKENAISPIKKAWDSIIEYIGTKWSEWVDNMPNEWQGCVDYIGQAWDEKMESVVNKLSEAKKDIINKWEEVKTSLSEAFNKIIDPVKEVIKNVKELIGKLGEIKVPNPIELIKKGFDGIGEAIKCAKEWVDKFNLASVKDKVINVTKNILPSSAVDEPVQQTLESQDEEEFNITKSVLSMQELGGTVGLTSMMNMGATNQALNNLNNVLNGLGTNVAKMNLLLSKMEESSSGTSSATNVTFNNTITQNTSKETDIDELLENVEARQRYQLRKLGVFDK